MANRIPILTFGEYVVTFEAQEEEISARHHFVSEFGWTAAQFRRIENFPFFCAHVVLWRNGEEVADTYLGACCYKTEREFFTRYAGDYFADMVYECADESKDLALVAMVATWRDSLRKVKA